MGADRDLKGILLLTLIDPSTVLIGVESGVKLHRVSYY